jgi:tetratricopeptide (TPR) repeat protein
MKHRSASEKDHAVTVLEQANPYPTMSHRSSEITDEFLAQLKENLVRRRVGRGLALLEDHRHLLTSPEPQQKNAGRFAGYLAQWVDIGFQPPSLVTEVVSRFPKSVRSGLSLHDYTYLRLAEGMVAMTEEATEDAIHHFDLVLALDQETDDDELLSVANFWKGRCLRMKGDYDQALAYAIKGRELAAALGHEPMAAVMRVLESWLFFQKGNLNQATAILQEAEAILSKTDDHLTLGNILSSYGRIARHQGRYHHAIEHFTAAIAEYKKRDPQHRNVARSLSNMASVKRLVALQLGRKMDADVARRRKAVARGRPSAPHGKPQYRSRFEQLRQEALAELAEAAAIYEQYRNHHGLGSVHLNYGYLHLDNGDLELADSEAKAAFRLAEEKRDHILMARARLLQCMSENTRVEEEIGDGAEPGGHARLAQDCATEAIELAKHTQNRRLLADAYIWQGLTYSNRFFDDIEAARRCYDQAITFTKDHEPDDSWDDIHALKARILRSGSVNPILRAWSQGSVGDKTFQQITDEFAELIVPKVWEREGRKISRVATRLSMSPKKVRRILSRIGKRKPGGK